MVGEGKSRGSCTLKRRHSSQGGLRMGVKIMPKEHGCLRETIKRRNLNNRK